MIKWMDKKDEVPPMDTYILVFISTTKFFKRVQRAQICRIKDTAFGLTLYFNDIALPNVPYSWMSHWSTINSPTDPEICSDEAAPQ